MTNPMTSAWKPWWPVKIAQFFSSGSTKQKLVGGLVAIFYFPIYWVANHPNWRTHIFQRGGPTTNQKITAMHEVKVQEAFSVTAKCQLMCSRGSVVDFSGVPWPSKCRWDGGRATGSHGLKPADPTDGDTIKIPWVMMKLDIEATWCSANRDLHLNP